MQDIGYNDAVAAQLTLRVRAKMSYDITISLAPVAADDKAAWQQHNQWLEKIGEPLKGDESMLQPFARLHADLTARFPCICDLPDDRVDGGVWSDGPLSDNFGHEVAELGIVFSRVEEVLPFLIDTANRLGLTVFDRQTDQIHRPGQSSPAGNSKSWWQFWK
jgi:hypothetical protein